MTLAAVVATSPVDFDTDSYLARLVLLFRVSVDAITLSISAGSVYVVAMIWMPSYDGALEVADIWQSLNRTGASTALGVPVLQLNEAQIGTWLLLAPIVPPAALLPPRSPISLCPPPIVPLPAMPRPSTLQLSSPSPPPQGLVADPDSQCRSDGACPTGTGGGGAAVGIAITSVLACCTFATFFCYYRRCTFGKGGVVPQRKAKLRQTLSAETKSFPPMDLVRIDANTPHERPPIPKEVPPNSVASCSQVVISECEDGMVSFPMDELRASRSPPTHALASITPAESPMSTLVSPLQIAVMSRGVSTYNPRKSREWQERRASLQRTTLARASLDSAAPPASPLGVSAGGRQSSYMPSSGRLSSGPSNAKQPVDGSLTIKSPTLATAEDSSARAMAEAEARPRRSGRTLSTSLFQKVASLFRKSSSSTSYLDQPVQIEPICATTSLALNLTVEKICTEVRQTETDYISDLNTVLTVYVRPVVELRQLTMEDTVAIFANLEELCRCASVLSELMDRPGDSVSVLAAAFIKVAPFFRLYAYYCRNYEKALITLARCRKHVSGFNDFLIHQAALPACRGLSLESFLIKPVQRLTKYPLFWKELLKHTPHTHPERATLERADELVRTVSMAVNQTLNDEIARLKTVQLLGDLGPEWLELIAPHRNLVLEFHANVHISLRPLPVVGYVLTDLLILCQLGRGGRQTPWLLTYLHHIVINQILTLESISPRMKHNHTASLRMQAPLGVPTSRMLNLRIPPDEELWLEVADESSSYQLYDRLTALGEAASRQFSGSDSLRSGTIDEIVVRLRERRAKASGASSLAKRGRFSIADRMSRR